MHNVHTFFNSYSYSCHEYCGICSDIRNEQQKKYHFFPFENASIVVARIRPFPFNFIDCWDRVVYVHCRSFLNSNSYFFYKTVWFLFGWELTVEKKMSNIYFDFDGIFYDEYGVKVSVDHKFWSVNYQMEFTMNSNDSFKDPLQMLSTLNITINILQYKLNPSCCHIFAESNLYFFTRWIHMTQSVPLL